MSTFIQNKSIKMILIEDNILETTQLTEQEIRTELAIALLLQRRLSFGQARKLAGMAYFEFEKLLADRNVPASYDEAAFEKDLLTLEKLKTQHGHHQ